MEVSGNFQLRPLYTLGKNTWYTLDRRLVEPHAVVKRKIPSLCHDSNPR
jgi:hypothetical protein